MSATAEPTSPRASRWNSTPAWVFFLVPALLGLLAITGRSFWIDECVTAQYVSQPTFSEWRSDLWSTGFAEAQMPLYLFYLWVWEKVFGAGEWTLRVAGLPWFVMGTGLFGYALGRLTKKGWMAWAVTASSAFLWYYLNEARLYSAQFGAAAAGVASLVMLARSPELTSEEERWWFRGFLASTLILSGISIIGMLWAGAATLALGVVLPPRSLWLRIRSAPILVVVWVAVHGGLAVYYIGSVVRGARASSMATTNLQTNIYVGYELLGFTGWGPGRDALREQGMHALSPHLLWLGVYALLVLIVLGAGVGAIWRSPWRIRAMGMGCVIALPTLFLLATGVLRHFRVLGRHFTPLLAVLFLVLALGLAWLWRQGRWGRGLAVLYLVLALLSAVQVRWAERHQKEDYRSAAAFSRGALAEGQRVWWAAAAEGAAYYQLPLTEEPGQAGGAYAVFGQTALELAPAALPDWVVISRPDIYDYQGGLAGLLEEGGFTNYTRFPGFVVWARVR